MAQAQHGEYAAFDNGRGVRFQRNSKFVKEANIPPEVAAILKRDLGLVNQTQPKFPRPTPEQLAAIRAEQTQVKPELQMSQEEYEQRSQEPNQEIVGDTLSEDDFDEVVADIEKDVNSPTEDIRTLKEHAAKSSEFHEGYAEGAEAMSPSIDPNFLESVSIHSASLEDIAQSLYERFGIYTVYLRKLPVADEINPLTGQAFTRHHLGLAYQSAIYAQNQGLLDRAPEQGRALMDAGRKASETFQVDPVAHTMGQARQANDFNFRTSVRGTQEVATTEIVHEVGSDGVTRAVQRPIEPEQRGHVNGASQRYSADEDEQILEPPIFGTTPIIRPNW